MNDSKYSIDAFNAILSIDIQISEMFFKAGVARSLQVSALRDGDKEVLDELAELYRRREEEKR